MKVTLKKKKICFMTPQNSFHSEIRNQLLILQIITMNETASIDKATKILVRVDCCDQTLKA